jgi:hypothetical protein
VSSALHGLHTVATITAAAGAAAVLLSRLGSSALEGAA